MVDYEKLEKQLKTRFNEFDVNIIIHILLKNEQEEYRNIKRSIFD